MKTGKETLQRLKQIQQDYPKLTFNNQGYQYLSKDILDEHAEQVKEILKLLREYFINDRILEFNNFKIRKDGSLAIRCQTKWDQAFTGVTYIPESDFQYSEEKI